MRTKCSHCTVLIESAITTDPHQYLVLVKGDKQASIFHCKLCQTMFEFTEQDIFLLEENSAKAHADSSACA